MGLVCRLVGERLVLCEVCQIGKLTVFNVSCAGRGSSGHRMLVNVYEGHARPPNWLYIQRNTGKPSF